jgi:hypothetical protein
MKTRLRHILFVCLLVSGVMGCGPAYVRHSYGPEYSPVGYGTPYYYSYSPGWYSYSYSPSWGYWHGYPRYYRHHYWYWR